MAKTSSRCDVERTSNALAFCLGRDAYEVGVLTPRTSRRRSVVVRVACLPGPTTTSQSFRKPGNLSTMRHLFVCWILGFLALTGACADDDALVPVPEGVRPNLIAAGLAHTCMLLEDGSPVCWGAGSPDFPNDGIFHVGQAIPPEGEMFVQIVAGDYHTCGMREDGTLRCWGHPSSVADTPVGAFASMSAGGFGTCALDAEGRRTCWGPEPVPPAADDERFSEFSQGGGLSCAVWLDGKVECWFGSQPLAEPVPQDVRMLDVESFCACGLDGRGRAKCWGQTCADGDPPQGSFIQFNAGVSARCGLTGDLQVVCSGEWAGPPYPHDAASIATGIDHTCARTTDGQAFCLGFDTYDSGVLAPPPHIAADF